MTYLGASLSRRYLITEPTDADHLKSLQEVLSRLEKAGLRLQKQKCSFMVSSVSNLGYQIDKEGLHPLASKLEAIKQAPQPRNVKELKSFLGLLKYYGKFLPHLPTVLAPLYQLLRQNVLTYYRKFLSHLPTVLAPLYQLLHQNVSWKWISKHVISSQVLVYKHFHPELDLILACDASSYSIGAVLGHRMSDRVERPIAFASRTLTDSKQRYAQIEREALACVSGVKKFHSYQYGHHFTHITDHNPC